MKHNDMNESGASGSPAKKPWTSPVLERMVAGRAESQRGSKPDGGGGFQGS